MKNVYPHLQGSGNIDDFFRMLDSHQKKFLHKKYLSKLIVEYFDSKIFTGGQNRSTKLRALLDETLKKTKELEEHFGFKLVKVNETSAIGHSRQDYQLMLISESNNTEKE
jgi:hypothetical protein